MILGHRRLPRAFASACEGAESFGPSTWGTQSRLGQDEEAVVPPQISLRLYWAMAFIVFFWPAQIGRKEETLGCPQIPR